jgi:hypothetical protein
MAKRPIVNAGSSTVEAATPEGGGRRDFSRLAAPRVDVNPETNPATARLADSAPFRSPERNAESIQNDRGTSPVVGPVPKRDKPRWYFQPEDFDRLEIAEREYRRVTGDDVSSSRVLRAALAAFIALPSDEQARLVRQMPDRRQRREVKR